MSKTWRKKLGFRNENRRDTLVFQRRVPTFFNVMLSLFEYSHFSNNRFLLSHYCKTKYKPYRLCYLHTPVPQSPYPSNCLAVKTCAEGGFTCYRHPPSASLALDSTNSHSFCSRYSIFRSFFKGLGVLHFRASILSTRYQRESAKKAQVPISVFFMLIIPSSHR